MERDLRLVFVVGMPRSGTKLLRDLLNRNPSISILPNETHFIPYLARRFGQYGDVSNRENFGRLFDDVRRATFFQRMEQRGVRFDEASWYQLLHGPTLRDVLWAFFEHYARLTGCRIVGDKTPDYVTQVPLLHSLFPDALFVHILRDPRDYALSMRQAWGKSVDRSVQRWKSQVRKYLADVAAVGAAHHEVRYEDLIQVPRATLQAICSRLHVPFSESMLHLAAPAENLGDARGLLTVDGRNAGKWRARLARQEIDRIESIAGRLMTEVGYPVDGRAGDTSPSSFMLGLQKLNDGVNLFRFRIRDCGGFIGAVRQTIQAQRYSGVDE